MGVEEWDPKGVYDDVARMVMGGAEASGVKVFCLEVGRSRVEYWMVGLGKGKDAEGRIVGVRTVGVES